MSEAFVWFHNNSNDKPNQYESLYAKLLGRAPSGGPRGMTLFAREKGPFAGVRGGSA